MQHETELENIMRRYEKYEAELLYRQKQLTRPLLKFNIWVRKGFRNKQAKRDSALAIKNTYRKIKHFLNVFLAV